MRFFELIAEMGQPDDLPEGEWREVTAAERAAILGAKQNTNTP